MVHISKISNLFRIVNKTLIDNTKMSSYSMVAVGVIGSVSHLVFGTLYLYVLPMDYENFWMRAVGGITCFLLLINKHWPQSIKKFLPWYWFGVVLYTLPFFSTYNLFASNYSLLRSMTEMVMVFFVILIFPQAVLSILNMILGIVLAVLSAYLTIPTFSTLNHGLVASVHLPVLVYTLFAGLVFSRSNLKGMLAQERIKAMEALTGSMAHEMRNPLSQLKYRLDSIGDSLPRPTSSGEVQSVRAPVLDNLYRELAQGKLAVERGLQVITMTLDEVNSKPIDTATFSYLSAAKATQKAVTEYSYETIGERDKVKIQLKNDFTFKGSETMYVFILFNLMKNAFYYFKAYPDASATIIIDRGRVILENTRPGISPKALAHLFESFHTTDKPGGTGLGLAFCRRMMRSFGGNITCDSVQGPRQRWRRTAKRCCTRLRQYSPASAFW